MPAGANQLAQMTGMARLERPDRLLKDIVYLLIIKGKVNRIRSYPENFYVLKFPIFYKNTFCVITHWLPGIYPQFQTMMPNRVHVSSVTIC